MPELVTDTKPAHDTRELRMEKGAGESQPESADGPPLKPSELAEEAADPDHPNQRYRAAKDRTETRTSTGIEETGSGDS